ncbi:ABC transporter ATP-binding protein [Pseudonocardia asaccharolytica]|uniref:ABC transporter ATP-binding protein n=1 Tax=Pseudonocardia asaccharolytica TaxID=54010 RepID=UPI000408CD49|nr:ABC transporter ATP-binding protein [Pseudonocardia asaccharolytica]
MLEVTDLVVRYGRATALDGVSLELAPGEMVALVGPNGAGKSTLVDTLSGIVAPAAGRVVLRGRLAQVPEGRQLFAELSVADNLALGAWRSGRGRAGRDPARVFEVLPDLRPLAGRLAGTLSGGEQQMVAVGRALMADPDILAVDELSLGLAPRVVADLARHLRELNAERDTTVLLIEQNARLAFDLCRRAYVLESGRITASGPCVQLAESPQVARAYFGGTTEGAGDPVPGGARDP